jgi:hypothetical protein
MEEYMKQVEKLPLEKIRYLAAMYLKVLEKQRAASKRNYDKDPNKKREYYARKKIEKQLTLDLESKPE